MGAPGQGSADPGAAPAPVVSVDAPSGAPDPARFEAATAAIDAANSEDPNRMSHGGAEHPKELLHAQLMTAWLLRLDPEAGEEQHLAARAHHFRRWTRPRSAEPDGRAGYLRWRREAKRRHAAEVGELLQGHGYDPATVDRVGSIIRKEALATDAAVQTHEDCLCLVFLTTQLEELTERVGDDEMVRILVRTISKMGQAGIDAALALELDTRSAELVQRALDAPARPT